MLNKPKIYESSQATYLSWLPDILDTNHVTA
jgi:hypothetical protein